MICVSFASSSITSFTFLRCVSSSVVNGSSSTKNGIAPPYIFLIIASLNANAQIESIPELEETLLQGDFGDNVGEEGEFVYNNWRENASVNIL